MRTRIFGLLAALAVGLGGYLHLAIWRGGYRYAPVKELFLLNVGISGAVAAALAFHPRKLTAAAGVVVSLGSLAAFALSRGPGLPTLHGTFTEMALAPHNVRFLGGPAATAVLVAEAVAVAASTAMLLQRRAARSATAIERSAPPGPTPSAAPAGPTPSAAPAGPTPSAAPAGPTPSAAPAGPGWAPVVPAA